MKNNIILFTLLIFCLQSFSKENTEQIKNPKIVNFINYMSDNYNYDRQLLTTIFIGFKHNQKIIDLMNRPLEAKPWDFYQKYFVTDERIKKGVSFWNNNKQSLKLAEKTYHIPAEIIIAIMGMETMYGKITGNHNVFNSLATLAFFYPRREKFFTKELAEFLLMCREENLDPTAIKGSYAGAMGKTQFMPSSFRNYAIDFAHHNKRDIFSNDTDAIGSIANYLYKNGWDPQKHIIAKAYGPNDKMEKMLSSIKPKLLMKMLEKNSIKASFDIANNVKVSVIKFNTDDETQRWWIGLNNFYVITRYNTSKNYALAAVQLSDKIKQEYKKTYKN